MRRLRAGGAFAYDFVVGDDWRAVALVVVGLLATWAVHLAGAPAWWVLPVVVVAALATGVRRAAPGAVVGRSGRDQRRPRGGEGGPP